MGEKHDPIEVEIVSEAKIKPRTYTDEDHQAWVDHDLGDDPDGDIEGYDGGFTHPDIDPEMTSGIAIVTPEQYIERTPERRAAKAEQLGVYTFNAEAAQLAVIAQPVVDADQQDFLEDYAILRVLANKIFRRAIQTDTRLPEPPDIWTQVDLTELLRQLDEDDVSWRLSEWKGALTHGRS
jgi:hypothetical protein